MQARMGIALAGGVMEGGFYEIGALCALEDAIEGLDCTAMDAYVGVSAGAVIASLLANGLRPATLASGVIGAAAPAFNIDPDILFSPAWGEYAHRVLQFPGALARWARRRLERPHDVSAMGALMEFSALAPVGLFDTAPLERFLARAFAAAGGTNDFRELKAKLRVVAVKLNTSGLVAFGDEATAHVPISKAVQASVSLPGLYCPTEIDGEFYIDGVARRTMHASQALEAGVDLLFCVNPIVPVDMRGVRRRNGSSRELIDHGFPHVMSQTIRTLVHSRMRTGFRSYTHEYPTADLILLEPPMDDGRMFFSNIFSLANRRQVCEHAYASTMRDLASRASELEPVLERRGLRLRTEVLADPPRSPFGDATEPTRRGKSPTLGHAVDDLEDAIDRLEESLSGERRRE